MESKACKGWNLTTTHLVGKCPAFQLALAIAGQWRKEDLPVIRHKHPKDRHHHGPVRQLRLHLLLQVASHWGIWLVKTCKNRAIQTFQTVSQAAKLQASPAGAVDEAAVKKVGDELRALKEKLKQEATCGCSRLVYAGIIELEPVLVNADTPSKLLSSETNKGVSTTNYWPWSLSN